MRVSLFLASSALAVAALAADPAAAQLPGVSIPTPNPNVASTDEIAPPGSEIEFASETLEYDEAADIVTARGDVRVDRGQYRLRSDTVTWNRKTGLVEATGDVVVLDPQGNRVFGDRVELSETLRDGVIDNILLVLADGGRLAARRATRVDGVSQLERAVYSPCAVVGQDGCGKTPVWQIKAVRVTHDPVKNRIYYKRASFEFLGIPIFYLPSLSNPAGGNSNSTGLLAPEFAYTRSLGLAVEGRYYFAFDPSQDLTLKPIVYTAANPALAFDYRRYLGGGPVRVEGIVTYADRRSGETDGLNESSGDRLRGYLSANGRLVHGDAWRSTFSIRAASDATFLRRYEVSYDERLRSFYNLDRLTDRLAFSVQGWAFQGLRVTDRGGQTPFALPLIDVTYRPPAEVLGGRLELTANTLALARTDGPDQFRGVAAAEWELRRTLPMGARVTLTGLARGDVYRASDQGQAELAVYAGEAGLQARGIALVAAEMEYPLAGPFAGGVQTWTPRVQLIAARAGGNDRVPNEDSRAVELEDVNLFALNRFPGYDRFEDGARLTYGVDWAWDRPRLAVKTQLGQSLRLGDKLNLFPPGTGFEGRFSDIVSRVSVRFGRMIDLTQRLRLDADTLATRRHETDLTVGTRRNYATLGYVRVNRGDTFEDLSDREEARVTGRVAFERYWSVFGAAIVDLTSPKEDPTAQGDGFQPIRTRLGVAYRDECFEFGLSWRRDYVSERALGRGNSFLLTLALKNLG